MEIQSATYAEKLSTYPADVVVYVLRVWPSKSKWWPTWNELETDLDKAAAGRMAIVTSLQNVERQWREEQESA